MYFIEHLKDPQCKGTSEDIVTVEYRLACSGELYNEKVFTTDWRKSDATRLLLTTPFELFVASQPFNDYPQELALRFNTHQVTESKGNTSCSFLPDLEIAQDIAAFLSLFCRRLITVAAKVRESYPKERKDLPAVFQDRPVAFTTSMTLSHWKRCPSAVIYGSKGIEKIIDYNPPPKPINPDYLQKLFLALPHLEQAGSIVLSARLYTLALELIEQRPEISYQLLISSIETIANDVLRSFTPNITDMVETKRAVVELALKFGLSEEQAQELAITACRGDRWISRKFKKFLSDHVNDGLWTEDDVFKVPEFFLPKKGEFESALSRIYETRSKAIHAGLSYPVSGTLGGHPTVPAKTMLDLGSSDTPFPPVVWFERVVNTALITFLERCANENLT